MKQILALSFFLLTSNFVTAQKNTFKIPDSLKRKNYTYLDDRIYELRKDSVKASVYLFSYLSKAKQEQNWEQIVYAYQNILHQSPEKLRLIYADSMIYTAKKASDNTLVGSAYLSKGIVYYGQKKYQQAFDNYIVANNYISKSNDQYLTCKVKYHMAQIKYYLGFYDEAVSLFRECLEYFKNENPRAYLNTLHSLGVCYSRIGNYELCTRTNHNGLLESSRLNNFEMEAYFMHSDGINEFFKHNYGLAINKIESSLEKIKENKDFANESVGNFYIGKSYWALNRKEKALPYFQLVDKTFNDKKHIRPDQREMYEMLISYYDRKNDLKNELYNVNQLLKADTILKETYSYLVSKIHKQYDTKELQLKNTRIERQLILEKNYDVIAGIIILFLLILAIYMTNLYYKNKKLNDKKFEKLMNQPAVQESADTIVKKEIQQTIDIPEETVQQVLKGLDKFEREKRFLVKDIKQADLAAFVHTNSKYLYKILSGYKNKRFVVYINDLRIDFIIALLKEDSRYRKYSYAALTEEAGFSSNQQFAQAFKAKTGMSVNYFVEKIKELS
ncbi:MAG: tetratricopeptide repeat protein [Flavobacterium sp.]